MDPDDREFMRQLLLRHEKATDAMIAGLNANTARVIAGTDEIRANTAEMRALTRRFDRRTDEFVEEMRAGRAEFVDEMRAQRGEFVDEMRAQRGALFRILDRLDGGAAGAGA